MARRKCVIHIKPPIIWSSSHINRDERSKSSFFYNFILKIFIINFCIYISWVRGTKYSNSRGRYKRFPLFRVVTYLCGNPGGPGQWNPRISVLSLQSTKFRDQLRPPPALISPGPTDLEVNPRKASEDLQEGEHVLLAGEELEVGLLVHVPVLSAPTWIQCKLKNVHCEYSVRIKY